MVLHLRARTGLASARQAAKTVVDVFAGIALTIDTGSSFQFRNTGDEDLCFVIVTTPAWPGMDEAYPVPDYWPASHNRTGKNP